LAERIGALLEIDLLLAHPDGQPVMLVQAYPSREGKVWTHPDEHSSPAGVVEVEVVLNDPALSHLEMPAIVLLIAIGDQDASRFSGSDYGHDLIWLGWLEVGIDEVIAPSIGWLQYRRTPLLRPVCEPVLVLFGNVTEFVCV
jgi:hypothetical protein